MKSKMVIFSLLCLAVDGWVNHFRSSKESHFLS